MSRIGKMEIQIPEAVNISLGNGVVDIKGPKGNIVVPFHQDLKVKETDGVLLVERPSDSRSHRSLHGTTRQLIFNGVHGVTKGIRNKRSWLSGQYAGKIPRSSTRIFA